MVYIKCYIYVNIIYDVDICYEQTISSYKQL